MDDEDENLELETLATTVFISRRKVSIEVMIGRSTCSNSATRLRSINELIIVDVRIVRRACLNLRRE